MLFTCKQHCLHKKIFGDLPAMNICLFAKCQVRWCYGFGSTALQQDLEEEEEEEEEKEHEKTSFAVFPGCYVEIHLFLVNLFFFVCFRH